MRGLSACLYFHDQFYRNAGVAPRMHHRVRARTVAALLALGVNYQQAKREAMMQRASHRTWHARLIETTVQHSLRRSL